MINEKSEDRLRWQPRKRRAPDLTKKWAPMPEKAEPLKASVWAKVENTVQVVKNVFRHRNFTEPVSS